jgi:endonuclease YncB( thermonuclease family)
MITVPEVSYTYHATVLRVVDGDTAELDVDLGFDVHFRISVRFKGYNAPELHGPNKAQGQAAKEELTQLLSDHSIIIKTDKLFSQSFARYLATVYAGTADGWVSVAEHMTAKGFNVKQGQ